MKIEKELEVARLRSQQEKAKDKQSERVSEEREGRGRRGVSEGREGVEERVSEGRER